MSERLTDLRLKYPDFAEQLRESDDAYFDSDDSGCYIYFLDNDMAIANPYISSCGRFDVDPFKAYGIPHELAEDILKVNSNRS